jgi:hypothetical protein
MTPQLYLDLPILLLAVYRGTRFLIEDHLAEPLRERIWKKYPPHTKFGYLFTCYWCMSFWVASMAIICYTIVPTATVLLSLPFALSAIVGYISTKIG